MANIIRRGQTERPLARPAAGWDPFRMMGEMLRWDPFREMESLLQREDTFAPRFEVKETKDAYVFKADLPGVKEGDLEIGLTGNQLTISGHREEERREEGENYYTSEVTYGSFSRSFTLPSGVDSEHVEADLKTGVLTVTIPKRAELQTKKIAIGGGSGEAKAKA